MACCRGCFERLERTASRALPNRTGLPPPRSPKAHKAYTKSAEAVQWLHFFGVAAGSQRLRLGAARRRRAAERVYLETPFRMLTNHCLGRTPMPEVTPLVDVLLWQPLTEVITRPIDVPIQLVRLTFASNPSPSISVHRAPIAAKPTSLEPPTLSALIYTGFSAYNMAGLSEDPSASVGCPHITSQLRLSH